MILLYLGILLALPVGFSLGLLGGGGSILAVPVFVYVLGIDPSLAIPASLLVVGLTSLVGSIPYWRQGNVDFSAALFFALGSMAGSLAGAELGIRAPDIVQMILFGFVMLAASFFMLRGRPSAKENVEAKPFWVLILIGALVGVLIGFVGVGGGFMYVPALIFLVGLETKRAVGTSLLIIGLNAAVAFSRYLFDENIRQGFLTEHLGELPLWLGLIIFTLLTFASLFVGTKLAKRTDPARLRRWFAIFLMLMALFVLVQEMSGV
ncbi:MAG: sulfite exporter TauE/SafE family protein [Candidatus Kapaibacterium sp.]